MEGFATFLTICGAASVTHAFMRLLERLEGRR